ncbi:MULTISPECIES: squalene/phytoene synthase family protein [unclassified Roseovarius]|uniref:squalene/phytoene synthase family protein n=1 Tax=unclassified Roseovarius TaxID=2614913 RepID=UPI00273F96AC|nr:squalene/phytoene synthase family protein [Roseovarius sp. MMSF_3350]
MVLDPDIMACAGLVQRGDPERFAATMAAPVSAREKLFPLYAFNVEVSRAPWVTQESMIAEMRLQWWRDVLEEIRTGTEVRRHEVATPLAAVLTSDLAGRLDTLVEARRWDIYRDPFEDMSAFRAHLTNTSGLLLLAAAWTLGDAPEDPILKAGYAQGVANWLRAVPELERQGRVPLVEGTQAAIRALADDALAALSEARRARLAPEVRPAMLALWQTDAILRKARRDPAAVSENRLTPPPFRSRLGLLHRALTGRW